MIKFYDDKELKVTVGELDIRPNFNTLSSTTEDSEAFFYEGGEEGNTWGTFSVDEAKELVKFLNKSIEYLEKERNL
jgi:hypothetical protein